MSILAKLRTAFELVVRLDFATLRRQWRVNLADRRLRSHDGQPFVHHDPGFPFVCHPDWPDSRDQFLENAGDHWEFQVLRRWLQPRDTVIDVGANLGLYAFATADCVGPDGLVIAVEASPYVVEKLARSVRLLAAKQVRPLHAAVTPTAGTITFYVSRDQTITSEQSLRPSPEQRACYEAVEVPARTLRDISGEPDFASKLSLVKIDIEGAEAGALSAAPPAWFEADGPLWLVEINPGALARFDTTPTEILAHFSQTNFERWLLPKHPYAPGGSTSARLVQADQAADFSDSLYYNFFALPKGARRAQRAARVRSMFPAHIS